jgi:hypothetical protein
MDVASRETHQLGALTPSGDAPRRMLAWTLGADRRGEGPDKPWPSRPPGLSLQTALKRALS